MIRQAAVAPEAIPRIIHQIWIGPNKKPNLWTDTFEHDYIAEFPHYSYKLWTENNINELFDGLPVYRQVYDLEPTYNGKSDVLRYLILYRHGGIYMDADSVWVNHKNFDELLDQVNDSGVFASTHVGLNGMCGGVMGSTKTNPIMKDLIDGLERKLSTSTRRQYGIYKKCKGACTTVGPHYLHRTIVNKNPTLFPSHYFYPVCWHTVKSIDEHLTADISPESFTYQYGYTTNNFKEVLN